MEVLVGECSLYANYLVQSSFLFDVERCSHIQGRIQLVTGAFLVIIGSQFHNGFSTVRRGEVYFTTLL